MQPPDSIIVKVIEEPVKSTTIVDVLVGSLGLELPEGYVEAGCDITQPEDTRTIELWCIGERI